MTSELEKQFFDTFGIEPRPYCCYHDCNCPIEDVGKFNSKCPKQAVTKECDARIMEKPQITDRILLKLICYLSRYRLVLVPDYACFKTIEELKENILKCAMKFITSNVKPMFYVEDIQKLFKEER